MFSLRFQRTQEVDMKVTDNVTAQRFGVDEAYERFFDGFYNLGKPTDVFERTVVLSPPRLELTNLRRRPRARGVANAGRKAKRPTGRR
jgi:hypothetical protein